MRFGFTAEEERFRAEVMDFLGTHVTGPAFFHRDPGASERLQELYRQLGSKGWLSLSWPREFGGAALPATYEFILWDEMAYARAARPPMGPGLVAKALMTHGTEAQQERYLPDLRLGRVNFALGYSEPDAGSDLGSVRTRAVPVDGGYRLSGTKCWTSNAHWADYLWTLCRTGSTEDRARGLTVLIVPLRSEGIRVSPIPTLDGAHLNEVVIDDVFVPVADRVGAENEGWGVVSAALAVERHIQFPPSRCRRDLEDVLAWVDAQGLRDDRLASRLLEDAAIGLAEVEASALGLLHDVVNGHPSSVAAAYHKLAGTLLVQEIGGIPAQLGHPSLLVQDTDVEFLWRQSILETIGGGTTEVMRNILARQDLGLGGRA